MKTKYWKTMGVLMLLFCMTSLVMADDSQTTSSSISSSSSSSSIISSSKASSSSKVTSSVRSSSSSSSSSIPPSAGESVCVQGKNLIMVAAGLVALGVLVFAAMSIQQGKVDIMTLLQMGLGILVGIIVLGILGNVCYGI